MSLTDLRTHVAKDLRLHPRVAYQGFFRHDGAGAELAADLPTMPPFRSDYVGAISILDWDHRIPSQVLALRVYAYYTEAALATGEEAFDDRLETIGVRDRFPEFDVPDFEHLAAEEQNHYSLLKNTYDFMADPEGFTGFDGGAMLDGG